MTPLGSQMPSFSLLDPVSKKLVSDTDFSTEKPLVVFFICNHCPYVVHIAEGLAAFSRDYAGRLEMVAINSNDADSYPDDSPEKMVEEVKKRGYVFSYLYDESQDVALSFGAACTPDIFVYDKSRKLVYRGQFDAARPGNDASITGESLRGAVEALLSGKSVAQQQIPSMGCNIKWKAGRVG